ncbi:MAG: peptidase M28, partial [Cyclobacteriaceae bacterium]
MKNTIAFLLFSLSLSFAFAQEVDLNAVHRIKEEGLNNSKVEEIAFRLTDASGPRLTNSAGYTRAADWAVKQLTEWGLKNAKQEKWGDFGKGWQIDKSYVAMTAPYYFQISGTPKAWTGGTNGPISGEVTLLAIDKEEDFKKFEGKIGGKIVLVKSGASTNPTFEADASRMTDKELADLAKQPIGSSSRYTPEMIAQYLARRAFNRKVDEFLKNEKAQLVIRGRNGKHGTYFTSNGASYSVDATPAIAEVETAPEHADLMARLLEKGISVKVEADIKTTFTSEPASYNVIGEIPGTDKDLKAELVML